MKKYRLLKDLPFAKAGEELYIERQEDGGYFTLYKDLDKMSVGDLHEGYIENFDEWFEEIEEPEEYFIINFLHLKITKISTDFFAEWVIENLKSLELLFRTEEEAEKYLKYLKAKEIIKQDAKGFKPDWDDDEEAKYSGYWDYFYEKFNLISTYLVKDSTIYFKSEEDIKESFKKHPKEWKAYLTYEQ